MEARCKRVCPHLYRLSRWGLSLRGCGDALRSESDSDTGLRGRDAEEVGRELGCEVDQVGTTGEDLGLGRVDTPERVLEEHNHVYAELLICIYKVMKVRPSLCQLEKLVLQF